MKNAILSLLAMLICVTTIIAQSPRGMPVKTPTPPDPRVLAMSETDREAAAYLYVKHSAEFARSSRIFTGSYVIGTGVAMAIMIGSIDEGDVPSETYLLTAGLMAIPGIITLAVKRPEENAYIAIQEGRIEPVSALGMWAADAKSGRQLGGGILIAFGALSAILPMALVDSDDFPTSIAFFSGAMIAAPGVYMLSTPSMPERMFDDVSPRNTAGLDISVSPTLVYNHNQKAWGGGLQITF